MGTAAKKSASLIVGRRVIINSGVFEGHVGVVTDNTPVDRKIKVRILDIDTEGGEGFITDILPRLLTPYEEGTQPIMNQPNLGVATMTTPFNTGTDGSLKLLAGKPITDPMDPSLDRFRPDPAVVKDYISRMVPGGFTDIDFLLAIRDQRDSYGYSPNVALVGETQSGKTMLVQVLAVLAAEREGLPKPYPVFTINGSSGVTSYDLYGQTTSVIVDGREVLVWMEGIVALACRAGGFLYLDEWNAVPPAQAVAIHPLLDDRRQFVNTQKAVPDYVHGGFSPEVVKANPSLWCISTINPGYKGTTTMAEATSNRFRWFPWDYDEAVEKQIIPSKTVRNIGAALREAYASRAITVPIGTSALQRFCKDCAQFGVDNAVWTLLGMFPPRERTVALTAIEDGGHMELLKDEYPEALFKAHTSEDGVAEASLGSTWAKADGTIKGKG